MNNFAAGRLQSEKLASSDFFKVWCKKVFFAWVKFDASHPCPFITFFSKLLISCWNFSRWSFWCKIHIFICPRSWDTEFIRFMVFLGVNVRKRLVFLSCSVKNGLVFIDTSVKTGLKMKGLIAIYSSLWQSR